MPSSCGWQADQSQFEMFTSLRDINTLRVGSVTWPTKSLKVCCSALASCSKPLQPTRVVASSCGGRVPNPLFCGCPWFGLLSFAQADTAPPLAPTADQCPGLRFPDTRCVIPQDPGRRFFHTRHPFNSGATREDFSSALRRTFSLLPISPGAEKVQTLAVAAAAAFSDDVSWLKLAGAQP